MSKRVGGTPVSKLRSSVGKPFKSPLHKTADKSQSKPRNCEQLQEQVNCLQTQVKNVDAQIAQLESEGYIEEELENHIKKLHEYNELKDVGQMVLGRIADLEGVQTKDLYPRYGLELTD